MQNFVPHKLFQYMIFEKPVVVSTCAPLKRIVEETESGLTFRAEDPRNLAQRILTLYKSPELYANFGENGKAAATLGKYSWQHHSDLLVKLYSSLSY